jgi:hypothetical protein
MTKKIKKVISSMPDGAVSSVVLDLLFLAGLGIACYGISLLNKPAAIIFAGLATSILAYLNTGGR